MTIFIDELEKYPREMISLQARKFGRQWCHLWTDGDIEELHKFAQKIGLKRSWFQDKKNFPHYDLVASKRFYAIEKSVNLREWWFQYKRKKHGN